MKSLQPVALMDSPTQRKATCHAALQRSELPFLRTAAFSTTSMTEMRTKLPFGSDPATCFLPAFAHVE